jgi:hypothetical protein
MVYESTKHHAYRIRRTFVEIKKAPLKEFKKPKSRVPIHHRTEGD